jgi:hypothetical protein
VKEEEMKKIEESFPRRAATELMVLQGMISFDRKN